MLIPYGAVITALNGLGNRMLDVMWDGKTVTIFTEDLRARGELVARQSRRRLDLGQKVRSILNG